MISAWIAPKTLRRSIAPVTALVDEAMLRFEDGGMRIQTVDPASIGAVSLDLLDSAFHSYEADGERISVDLDRLEEIVSATSDHGNYFIEKPDDEHRLALSTGGYEFELSLLSSETVRTAPDPRDLDTPATVSLDSTEFSNAIQVASMFSDHLKMGFNNQQNEFYMSAEGDQDDMFLTFGEDDVKSLEAAESYGNYSLAYLDNLRRAVPSNEVVKIGLGEEMPLNIQYEIADGNGRISYGLAPRI